MQVLTLFMRRSSLLLVLLAVPALTSTIEPEPEREIKRVLSTCMQQVRDHAPDECRKIEPIAKQYGVALLPYLEQYAEDPNERVRWQAYAWIFRIGLHANDVSTRQAIVYRLLKTLHDPAAYSPARFLQFSAPDFSPQAKESLHQELLDVLADGRPGPRSEIILLVGVADMKSELPRLKAFIKEREIHLKRTHEQYLDEWRQLLERNPPSFRKSMERQGVLKRQYWQSTLMWSALRASARMGVQQDIQRCIEFVEAHPDEGYRVTRLLRELSYVRQPEVISYLQKYLNSDKREPYSGKDVIRTTYARRAAMALAEMLRGFPGNKQYGGEIARCRKWMAEQEKWDIIR